jgi:mannose-1-phosphate guanylyltransferase
VIGSFAADHLIADDVALAAAVTAAVSAARDGYVCTIGIEPDSASTAFGYVETGDALSGGALSVRRFVEKPDAQTAAAYIATGRYRWNAGMFVTRADVLLAHLERQQPTLHEGLIAIADSWLTADRDATLAHRWPRLTRISIDHAIAEPVAAEGGIACVPGTFGWRDIGDFSTLSDLLAGGDVRVLGDPAQVRAIDATGVVVTGDRAITLLGVDDIVVVDTGDALLVTTRAQAQRVKEAGDAWRSERAELL